MITINYWVIPGRKHYTPIEVIVDPESIIRLVVNETGVNYKNLVSPSRKSELVQARYICMWLMRKLTPLSLGGIGNIFGRDHTTTIHALNTIDDHMATEPELRNFVERLRAKIINERP